jgi:hypothetical protein
MHPCECMRCMIDFVMHEFIGIHLPHFHSSAVIEISRLWINEGGVRESGREREKGGGEGDSF